MVKKIYLIVLGISLIAFFELSLYLTGKIFLYVRDWESFLDKKSFEKIVCCIGDSHTFGVGTSYRHSYPAQLERLLNLNNPQTSFNVVNLGIPGNSTRQQIERLAYFLDRNKTELVILLTGRNNYYEIKTWKNRSILVAAIIKIKKMRTYRIMQYVLNRLFKIPINENLNGPMEMARYRAYMRYHLAKAKSLCDRHNCKLLLISYYNSHDKYIERVARRLGIPYFNLYRSFFEKIPQEEIDRFVSKDGSHMSSYGYNLFAKLLYEKMYLNKLALSVELNPLVKEDSGSHQNDTISRLGYALGKSIFYEN